MLPRQSLRPALHGRKARPRSSRSGCAAPPPPVATAESWAGGRRLPPGRPPAAQPAAAAAAPEPGADAGLRQACLLPAGTQNTRAVLCSWPGLERQFSSPRNQVHTGLPRRLLIYFQLNYP
ncbi:hypothetical protein [Paenibacillus lentus]|nr:hypothetical protein [Paenibacillus lentus]